MYTGLITHKRASKHTQCLRYLKHTFVACALAVWEPIDFHLLIFTHLGVLCISVITRSGHPPSCSVCMASHQNKGRCRDDAMCTSKANDESQSQTLQYMSSPAQSGHDFKSCNECDRRQVSPPPGSGIQSDWHLPTLPPTLNFRDPETECGEPNMESPRETRTHGQTHCCYGCKGLSTSSLRGDLQATLRLDDLHIEPRTAVDVPRLLHSIFLEEARVPHGSNVVDARARLLTEDRVLIPQDGPGRELGVHEPLFPIHGVQELGVVFLGRERLRQGEPEGRRDTGTYKHPEFLRGPREADHTVLNVPEIDLAGVLHRQGVGPMPLVLAMASGDEWMQEESE